MIREAIEKIMSLGAADLDVTQQAKILAHGLNIQDLERFHPQRRRFRGQFHTRVIAGFVDYVNENSGNGDLTFINPDEMSARTYFDIGTIEKPGHCEHVAILQLQPTAPFDAWQGICGIRLAQRELREFVADWTDHLQDGKQAAADLYRAISTVTVDALKQATTTVGQFSQSRTALEEYTVAAKENALPEVVTFTCEPYPEFEPFTSRARLHAHIEGDKVTFSLVRTKETEECQELGERFKNLLIERLGGEESSAIVGTFNP